MIDNTNSIDRLNPNYVTITVSDGYYTIEKLIDTINGLLVRQSDFFTHSISAPDDPVNFVVPFRFC